MTCSIFHSCIARCYNTQLIKLKHMLLAKPAFLRDLKMFKYKKYHHSHRKKSELCRIFFTFIVFFIYLNADKEGESLSFQCFSGAIKGFNQD